MKVNFKRITLLFLTLFFIVSVNNLVAQNAGQSIPDEPQRFFIPMEKYHQKVILKMVFLTVFGRHITKMEI